MILDVLYFFFCNSFYGTILLLKMPCLNRRNIFRILLLVPFWFRINYCRNVFTTTKTISAPWRYDLCEKYRTYLRNGEHVVGFVTVLNWGGATRFEITVRTSTFFANYCCTGDNFHEIMDFRFHNVSKIPNTE